MLSGLRLLSDGMEQLAWAGGWHVTRFLYSRDTNLHLPMVLAMFFSAGELCLFSRQLCLFSWQLCLFSQQLCLFSRKACRRQRLWFGDLASIIASSMLTIVLIDNERGGRGEGREDPMASYLENVESRYLSIHISCVKWNQSLNVLRFEILIYDSCKTYFIFVRVWSGDNIDIIE